MHLCVYNSKSEAIYLIQVHKKLYKIKVRKWEILTLAEKLSANIYLATGLDCANSVYFSKE